MPGESIAWNEGTQLVGIPESEKPAHSASGLFAGLGVSVSIRYLETDFELSVWSISGKCRRREVHD